MSDRTAFQVYVYNCPEDQHGAAVDAIEAVTGHQWDEGSADDLAAGITVYEQSVGSADDLGSALAQAAPDASFYLWEDPAYEWLGDVRAYTPDLGMFAASCDSNGVPVLSLDDVLYSFAGMSGPVDADDIRAAISKRMGQPWREDWSAHCCTPARNGNG